MSGLRKKRDSILDECVLWASCMVSLFNRLLTMMHSEETGAFLQMEKPRSPVTQEGVTPGQQAPLSGTAAPGEPCTSCFPGVSWERKIRQKLDKTLVSAPGTLLFLREKKMTIHGVSFHLSYDLNDDKVDPYL